MLLFSIELERNGCVAGVEIPASVDDEDFYQQPAEELTIWLVIDDTSIYLAKPRSWQGRASIDYTWIERQKSEQPVGYPVDVHWVCHANE